MSSSSAAVLPWLVHGLNALSRPANLALLLPGILVPPLGMLVHEFGHAVTARRLGARVTHVVACAEGPAISFVLAGFQVRFGLGLGRDLRSRDPGGWALTDLSSLDAEQAIRVLRAGPLWQMTYGGAITLLVLAAPLWTPVRVLLVLGTISPILSGLASLRPNGRGWSDGARIANIRAWQGLIRSGVAAPRPTPELLLPPVASG